MKIVKHTGWHHMGKDGIIWTLTWPASLVSSPPFDDTLMGRFGAFYEIEDADWRYLKRFGTEQRSALKMFPSRKLESGEIIWVWKDIAEPLLTEITEIG